MESITIKTCMTDLLKEIPWLAGIVDDTGHQTALADLEELSSDESVSPVLLKWMAECIADYERTKTESLVLSHRTTGDHGVDALVTLMRHRNIKGKVMAEILELSPALLSSILTGKRALTIPHIYKLAEYFGVKPGVFL